MDVQYSFRPWPSLDPYLDALAVLLTVLAFLDALQARRVALMLLWGAAVPAVAICIWSPPAAVREFFADNVPLPARLTVVLGLIVYMSLRAYARSTRRLRWWKTGFLVALRLAALAAGFALLVRPTLTWSETSQRRGAVLWLFDVSGSMYDVKDAGDDEEEPVSRAEAVDRMLTRHAKALSELAPPDAAGKPRTRVFTFAERMRELPASALKTWAILYAGYPGGADDYARPPADPKKDPRLGRSGTAYGDAMEALAQASAQEMFTAVVVVGDGADNAGAKRPEEVAGKLKSWGLNGARLHTLNVGRPAAEQKDRRILAEDFKAPDVVPINGEVAASAKFTFVGLADRTALVQFLVDGKPVGETTVNIPADKPRFEHRADGLWKAVVPGQHELVLRATVKADPPPADPALRDHPDRIGADLVAEKSGQLRVDQREIKILYVDRIRPESRFVADALARAGEFRVERHILTERSAGDNGLPVTMDGWLKYDVVVIGDIPMNWFSFRQQKDLAAAVRDHGRGLLAMGGWRAFGPGGYIVREGDADDAPLASVLPIRCRREDGHVEGPVRFIPTREGLRDGPCALTPDAGRGRPDRADLEELRRRDDLRLYSEVLTPLDGANRVPYIRPRADGAPETRFNAVREGCTVFAISGTDPEQALLVGGRRKNGRVLALAADTTWKWVLRPGAEESVRQTTDLHRRFWRQLVQWLVIPPPDISFRLEGDGNTYLLSRMADYRPRAKAVLRNFTPGQARGVQMAAKLIALPEKPDDKPRELGRFPLQQADGAWTAELTGEWKVGRYEVRLAVAGLPDEIKLNHEPTAGFRIEDRDVEKTNTGAQPRSMESWAVLADERTGEGRPGEGRSFTIREFPELLKTLQAGVVEHTTTIHHRKDILEPHADPDNPEGMRWAWTLFSVCLALLLVEWIARKAWGLV